MENSHQDIFDFWFKELTKKQWFVADLKLDKAIKERFLQTHTRATEGKLESWRGNSLGRLAEILVLDQFSRNLFRGTPAAFASDLQALNLSKEAIKLGLDQELNSSEQAFLYMPYMHSEDLKAHEEAVKLFSIPGMEGNLEFEIKHKVIIEKFGRYPHRNEVLGRTSTPEEIEFLNGPSSSF
jgi:uncharacterized protein (DUF924 family)